jgi:TPR repeat protein
MVTVIVQKIRVGDGDVYEERAMNKVSKLGLYGLVAFLSVTSLLCFAQPQELDRKINEWRKEAYFVKITDIPKLEMEGARGDDRALYLLYASVVRDKQTKQRSISTTQLYSWAKRAADNGSLAAMRVVCGLEITGEMGAPKQPQNGLKACERAADQGLGSAMAAIAHSYFYGTAGVTNAALGIEWYEKAVQAGSAQAMEQLAYFLRAGEGIPKNEIRSFELFRLAAELGSANAMHNLAVALDNGIGIRKNPQSAFNWRVAAAHAGHRDSMLRVGVEYLNGLQRAPDLVKGFQLIFGAYEAGNVGAALPLSTAYRSGRGVDQDVSKADRLLAEFRDSASPDELVTAAIHYRDGFGVEKNGVLCLELFHEAERRRPGAAARFLGWSYWKADCGSKNIDLALKYLTISAETGDYGSMNALFNLYKGTDGVAKDQDLSIVWLKKAANGGDIGALDILASRHARGNGVPQDFAESIRLSRLSLQKGSKYAYAALGEAYANGSGVSQNEEEALRLFHEGAKQGDTVSAWHLGRRYINGIGVKQDVNRGVGYLLTSRDGTYVAIVPEQYGGDTQSSSKRMLDNLISEGKITDLEILKKVRGMAELAPSASWLSVPQRVISTAIVDLSVVLADRGGGIGRVELRINGVAVGEFSRVEKTERSASATESAAPPQHTIVKYPLAITEGTYRIEVRAYNAENSINFTSITSEVQSTYRAPRKPRLFALVIGVDEYENSNLKLKYAVNDATAMAAIFRTQIERQRLYSGGEVVLLTNKRETSKTSIERALDSFRNGGPRSIDKDDVFVLYVAAHGTSDPVDKRYKLFSSDVLQLSTDRLNATAIDGDYLQMSVAKIPSLKKLILLDTCNSGAAIPKAGANAFVSGERDAMGEQRIIETMTNRSGATVLAASTSEQAALEGVNGHGVFTWHLLEGLRGHAITDQLALISTDALKIYIENEVPITTAKLFNGRKQTPFSATIGQGFPIVSRLGI